MRIFTVGLTPLVTAQLRIARLGGGDLRHRAHAEDARRPRLAAEPCRFRWLVAGTDCRVSLHSQRAVIGREPTSPSWRSQPAERSCLLYLDEPISAARLVTSVKCSQFRTHAPQQTTCTNRRDLLDHLVGAGEQRRWDFEIDGGDWTRFWLTLPAPYPCPSRSVNKHHAARRDAYGGTRDGRHDAQSRGRAGT